MPGGVERDGDAADRERLAVGQLLERAGGILAVPRLHDRDGVGSRQNRAMAAPRVVAVAMRDDRAVHRGHGVDESVDGRDAEIAGEEGFGHGGSVTQFGAGCLGRSRSSPAQAGEGDHACVVEGRPLRVLAPPPPLRGPLPASAGEDRRLLAVACCNHAFSRPASTTPACCASTLPLWNTIRLGMPRMLYRAAICGCASVSTFRNRNFGSSSRDTCSKIGAIA